MASAVRWALFMVTSSMLLGCANDLLLKRQAETEGRVERLTQTDQKNLQQLNMQAGQLQSLSEQIKTITAQMTQTAETLRTLRTAQEELKAKITLVSQHASTPKVEVVNPAAPPTKQPDSGPPADYVKAFGLYSANNFPGAIEAFEKFLKGSPDHDFTPNAAYWIGECHYSLSNLPAALAAFQGVTEKYPKSAKAPDALLKQGYTLVSMKEKEKARVVFESIIKAYPSSTAAVRARERLSAR